ncbi:hypothetical protein B0T25DRAFT_466620 [Lasiosphaeria hispida]|uniref:Pfs domain protein n=1 Tax=Lasiosphaeria hispida TaxID=260671 RepID=A0AAJ0M7M9_9PEZI|nr:hypothetical protein B0T25DRAFT_466620 [Lasiosphaeria hispida]
MAILPLCNDSGYGSLAARSVATGKFQDTAVQQPTDLPRPYSGTDEAMETASVLSNNNSILRNPNLDRYISAFADQLAACVPPGFGATTTRTTTGGLDHLLKVFAVRLSHESTERPQRHLMYIAYRFRSDIVNHVQRSLNTSDDVESDVASSDSDHDARDTEPVMDLDEKIRHLWDRRTCIPQSSELDPTTESLDDYCDILVNTSAYRWLKTSLETSSALYIPSPRTSQAGADFPKPAALVPTQISRTMTQRLTLQFTVAWDPVLFAQGQQYDAPMSTVLARAITLTGYGNNLQATTCQKYVEQTWPYTGTAVLELVQRVFDSKEGGSKKTTLGDSTELIVDFVDGQLNLDATGSVFSVAEVAEQVAWIGAALRSSPSDDQAAYVSARILDLRLSGTSVFGNVHTTSGSCRIEFDTELLHDAELAVAGKCWRGMFGNPVIVRGFPIPRRADTDTGLEVPLDMVARLTNCQRVVNFAGTTFIKGFAAMLTAVKVVGDTVYWHLSYNADGSYISYAEWEASGSFASQTLSMDSIARSRAPDAEYEIEWTELPSPNSSCVLEKVTVSGSAIPFITPGTSFLIGVKDKPLHLGFGSGNDYMGNLMTIGKRHVVFYDTNEKRAWLVDGVSAVLHLLRAYLKFYVEDDRLGSYFMYSHGDIEEARPNVAYTGAKAAYEVLTSEKNQSLPLYPKRAAVSEEKTVTLGRNLNEETTTIKLTHSNFTLAERVEQIVHILLQITAYHDHGSTQSGYGFRIKSSPCHHIEGFEFMDVATRHDTLWPKVATVQAMSVGWVHLIRSLHAVTLFGIGFGELFRPALRKDQKQPCCIPTSLMPTGKDFLAVYGADLQDMLRTGSKRRDPWRLAGNLHWHSPGEAAFESCKCKTDPDNPKQPHSQDLPAPERKGFKGFKTLLGKFNTTTNNNNKQSKQPLLDPSNRVQVLLPATFPHLFGRGLHSPTRIAPNGAVIFGHAWSFPLRWSLTKDVPPEEGEPDPPSVDDVAGLMSDSGVGTSVDSSNSGPSPPAASFYGLGSNDGFLKCEDEPSEGGSLAGEDSRGEVRRKRSFDGVGGVIESSRAKVRRLESGEHTSG